MAFYQDLNYLKQSKGPLLKDLNELFQTVYTILGTKKGSRLFRPTWGGYLGRYLFEPCDEMTARSMLYDITNSLEGDIRLNFNASKSSVVPDPTNRQFLLSLKFDVPGFSDYETTMTLTFKQ